MNKLAIVGIFYDGYYDIWEDFLELLELKWKNNPYPVYIVNNEKKLCYDKDYNVTVIHAGKNAEYSKKVQVALDKIDCEYYLLLLEDFFFSEDVNTEKVVDILKLMDKNSWKYYKMTIPDFLNWKDKNKKLSPIKQNAEYTVSCQPSFWQKDFLCECIGKENYNAWIFEGIYSVSKIAHSDYFLKGCMFDYTNPLNLRHGYVQGNLLPSVKKIFEKQNYKFKAQRQDMTKYVFFKYRIKQILNGFVPVKVKSLIKKCISNTSISEKYRSEVQKYMELMKIK